MAWRRLRTRRRRWISRSRSTARISFPRRTTRPPPRRAKGDFAIAYGDGASATATGTGTGNFAFADGVDTIAKIAGANYNIAEVYDPAGTLGSVADAGTNSTAAGDYDLADIFGVDGATANAQGADYAYAIVNLLDSQSGSAETIGGFLSELIALF